jgi:hypothetical protein
MEFQRLSALHGHSSTRAWRRVELELRPTDAKSLDRPPHRSKSLSSQTSLSHVVPPGLPDPSRGCTLSSFSNTSLSHVVSACLCTLRLFPARPLWARSWCLSVCLSVCLRRPASAHAAAERKRAPKIHRLEQASRHQRRRLQARCLPA